MDKLISIFFYSTFFRYRNIWIPEAKQVADIEPVEAADPDHKESVLTESFWQV
jgi:hypothetical protein